MRRLSAGYLCDANYRDHDSGEFDAGRDWTPWRKTSRLSPAFDQKANATRNDVRNAPAVYIDKSKRGGAGRRVGIQ